MANTPPEVLECDHDWEDIGGGKQQCTYPDCQVIRSESKDYRVEVKGESKN